MKAKIFSSILAVFCFMLLNTSASAQSCTVSISNGLGLTTFNTCGSCGSTGTCRDCSTTLSAVVDRNCPYNIASYSWVIENLTSTSCYTSLTNQTSTVTISNFQGAPGDQIKVTVYALSGAPNPQVIATTSVTYTATNCP